jgi:hypothetical protein
MDSDFEKAYRRSVDQRARDDELAEQKHFDAVTHRQRAESLVSPYLDELAANALEILRREGVDLGKSRILPSSSASFQLNKAHSNFFRQVWTLNCSGYLRLFRNGVITGSGSTDSKDQSRLFDTVRIGGGEVWAKIRGEAVGDWPQGPYLWYNTDTSQLMVAGSNGQNQPYASPFMDHSAHSVARLVEAWHNRKR